MRKYVFHLYNYILHVYAGRPGGYPEAILNKKKKRKRKYNQVLHYFLYLASLFLNRTHMCKSLYISDQPRRKYDVSYHTSIRPCIRPSAGPVGPHECDY